MVVMAVTIPSLPAKLTGQSPGASPERADGVAGFPRYDPHRACPPLKKGGKILAFIEAFPLKKTILITKRHTSTQRQFQWYGVTRFSRDFSLCGQMPEPIQTRLPPRC